MGKGFCFWVARQHGPNDECSQISFQANRIRQLSRANGDCQT